MAQDLEKIEEIPSLSSPNNFNSFNNTSLSISNSDPDDLCLDVSRVTSAIVNNVTIHHHNNNNNNINHSDDKTEITLKVETLAGR
jgi:hypothetical protein